MTEERWTEQTAEHVARIAHQVGAPCRLEDCRHPGNREPYDLETATAILAALADAGLLVAPDWHPDPEGTAQLITYSDGWQYAVEEPDTDEPLVYGDQYWVSSGKALADSHPNGRIVRRKVAAYAGPWREVSP